MAKKLIKQDLYMQACSKLNELGLKPSDFCIMTLANDIIDFVNDVNNQDMMGGEIGLADTVGAFCEDNMAYEALQGEIEDAWAMLEDVWPL